MKLSKADLDSSVTHISSNVKSDRRYITASKPMSVYYDIDGKEHMSLDDDMCYARTIYGLNGAKHQIIVNLRDEVFLKDDDFYLSDSQRFAKLNGRPNNPYKFVSVSREILVEYVTYLSTGSLAALRRSQSGI